MTLTQHNITPSPQLQRIIDEAEKHGLNVQTYGSDSELFAREGAWIRIGDGDSNEGEYGNVTLMVERHKRKLPANTRWSWVITVERQKPFTRTSLRTIDATLGVIESMGLEYLEKNCTHYIDRWYMQYSPYLRNDSWFCGVCGKLMDARTMTEAK